MNNFLDNDNQEPERSYLDILSDRMTEEELKALHRILRERGASDPNGASLRTRWSRRRNSPPTQLFRTWF
jgi:hypothetical protein